MTERSPSIATLNRPILSPSAAFAAKTDDIVISCYENEVPSFVEAELPRVYGNIHSSLAHLKVYGGMEEITHTYVARKHSEIVALFLFHRDSNSVRVINEGMRIDDAEMNRFAAYVFSRWPSVGLISMHAVDTDNIRVDFPHQQYVCTANIVLPLPATVDDYTASLGKNMRRNLRRYMDKLTRSFPSFQYAVFEREAVNEQHVRDIIDLNRARIADKKLTYGIDNEIEQILALTRQCGLVGVATVDGRVIGGAVGYLVGENYFFKVIAHDPKYNDYSAGILCCFLTISACIARGCKEYNFMWNEYEYKFALGAHSRSLYHLVVYRSRLHMLFNLRAALQVAISGSRHRISALLDKAGKPDSLSPAARRAVRVLNALRQMKKLASGYLRRS